MTQLHPIQQTHVGDVVRLHLEALSMGITSAFGADFLERMYTRLLQRDNRGYVAVDAQGRVIGFVLATQHYVSLLGCLRVQSVLALLRRLLCDSAFRRTFLSAVMPLYFCNDDRQTDAQGRVIELSQIAVEEGARSQGVGAALIAALEAQAKTQGFERLKTHTHNPRLIAYYIAKKSAVIEKARRFGEYDFTTLSWKL